MRKELEQLEGKRIKVFAEVSKFGEKRSFRGMPKPTVCLINLQDEEGNILGDHLWLTIGKQVKDLKLTVGDKISFYGRAKEYVKGYFGRREDVYVPAEIDYKLSNPSRFEKLSTPVAI